METTAPTFSSASASADGRDVTVTFSEALDSTSLPAAGAFTIGVDAGTAPTVASYTVSGATATLKLSSRLTTKSVDVSYAMPSGQGAARLQDAAGNALASFSEKTVATDALDLVAPAFSSASASADGRTVTVTFGEALDGASLPAAGSFTIGVDSGTAPTVDSYTVSDAKAALKLSSRLATKSVTVSYAKPSGEGATPLQDVAGNAAASFSEETVATSELDLAVPTVSFSPAAGTTKGPSTDIVLTFSEPVYADAAGTAFTDSTAAALLELRQTDASGTAIAFAAKVATSGTDANRKFTVDPASDLPAGDVYAKIGNAFYDAVGNQGAASSATFAVDATAPAFSSASASADGDYVTVVFDEALDGKSLPDKSAFSVAAGSGVSTSVTSYTLNGTSATLRVATSIAGGRTVTVTYAKPSAEGAARLQDASGNAVASFSSRPVTNNSSALAVWSASPAHGAVTGAKSGNIVVTFNQAVYADANGTAFTAASAAQLFVIRGPEAGFPNTASDFKLTATLATTGAGANRVFTVDPSGDFDQGRVFVDIGHNSQKVYNASGTAGRKASIRFTVETSAPELSSASVSKDGRDVTLVFSEAMNEARRPPTTAFTVGVGSGTAPTVASYTLSGKGATLRLGSPLPTGAATLSYDMPTGTGAARLEDPAGNALASFEDRTLTNLSKVNAFTAATQHLLNTNLTLRHVTAQSDACLDVQAGKAANGQSVQTWTCNGTAAQSWRLEQRSSGSQSGRYRLVSGVGGGSTYCLDNRGHFATSNQIGIWSCVGDTHGAVENQTFDLAVSGDGLTLTFTRGTASSVLWADRTGSDPKGGVSQRAGGTGSSAEWRLVPTGALAFSAWDASVTEAAGAQLAFRVSLNRAVSTGDGTVSVGYSTKAGTATEGVDYTATSGTLVFAAGERERTVNVAVLDDAIDDDGETLTLVLSGAMGATIADKNATGTIANSDPMPQAWLARFGRVVAEQVLDAVSSRMSASREPGAEADIAALARRPGYGGFGPQGSGADPHLFGGTQVAPDWVGQGRPDQVGAGRPDWAGGVSGDAYALMDGPVVPHGALHDYQSGRSFRDASFMWTRAPDESGGTLATWGRSVHSSFAGRDGSLSVDGEVTTSMLGADYGRDDWLAGIVLSRTFADGGYGDSARGDGGIDAVLNALTAFGARDATPTLGFWGAAGYGTGMMRLAAGAGPVAQADLAWSMAAAGLRKTLTGAARGGPSLALVTDGLWARTTSGAGRVEDGKGMLAGAQADVTRLRLGLEGSWDLSVPGTATMVTPKLGFGARHDAGDAETGFGLELSGGVAWAAPALGLMLDLSGRSIVAHDDRHMKESGVSLAVAFSPGSDAERGPEITLRHDLGAPSTGGLDAMFEPYAQTQHSGLGQDARRFSLETAYRLPVFDGRYMGKPQLQYQMSGYAREIGFGWQLLPVGDSVKDRSFMVMVAQREDFDGTVGHGIGLALMSMW